MTWVVFYDVRSNRNRSRIAKRLVLEGLRVQKSVFWVEANPAQVQKLCAVLADFVDPQTDSVCAWPLADSWQQRQISVPNTAMPILEGFIIA